METALYRCGRCKIDTFTRDEVMKQRVKNDYVYYWCRPCNRTAVQKYRQTVRGSANTRKASYGAIQRNPEKQRARLKVYYAVRRGYLKRPTTCTGCKQNSTVQGHHTDYLKPLDVIWLCRTCHALADRKLVIA